jgi:outer membrane protein OmpA-like peptidoglycan-associated protein
VVEFIGMVFNEATGEEVETGAFSLSITNKDQQGSRDGDFENGRFTSSINAGSQVLATITAKGYLKSERSFEIADSLNLFEAIFKLAPIERGKAMNIPNLLFELQSDEIVPVSFPVLDSIANVMVSNSSIEILLSGHTDVIGDKELNFQLSFDRANSVKDYLVGRGVLAERIRVEAFGGARPIASSGREETRRLNRRVEITVIKD